MYLAADMLPNECTKLCVVKWFGFTRNDWVMWYKNEARMPSMPVGLKQTIWNDKNTTDVDDLYDNILTSMRTTMSMKMRTVMIIIPCSPFTFDGSKEWKWCWLLYFSMFFQAPTDRALYSGRSVVPVAPAVAKPASIDSGVSGSNSPASSRASSGAGQSHLLTE